MNNKFYEAVRAGKAASAIARDMIGRVTFCKGKVVAIDDPLSLRRIKVILDYKGLSVTSDWLFRYTERPGDDPELPPIGSTVEVKFFGDDPHKGYYGGIETNAANPPLKKADFALDDSQVINNNFTRAARNDVALVAGNNWVAQAEGDLFLSSNQKSVAITTTEGKSLTLTNGQVTLELRGNKVRINGEEIAVVSARDSDGDRVVSSGQD